MVSGKPGCGWLSGWGLIEVIGEMADTVIRTGWVDKKNHFGWWRKRWLVLSRFTLATYVDEHEMTVPTKVLDLHTAKFSKEVSEAN